jgi:alkaline phosphatase D
MSDCGDSRRRFLKQATLGGTALTGLGGILVARRAPAFVASDVSRPSIAWGIQIGDVLTDSAIVWSRTDRPARLVVEWSTDERFRSTHRSEGSLATDATDFTVRVDLQGLPDDSDICLRVHFESAASRHTVSETVLGRFRTAPRRARKVRFLWSGDTAGQGWGIDLSQGGMRTYEAMRQTRPDFFIHSGDNIYADGVMTPEVKDSAGNVIWTNAYLDVVPEKTKVAETLNEYRRAYLYNRYDANIRAFSAEVPQVWQWDDHEVINNWSPSKVLDSRYTTTDIQVLVARATQAFHEYSPMRPFNGDAANRVYRHIPYGPDIDVFVLDMRSYRAGNSCNVQPAPGPETQYLGETQRQWLKQKLQSSQATWKIIASDMPLGIQVGDGTSATGCPLFENSANGDGPVLGREFEIADLLRFIKQRRVDNVVWLTADVHYAAAHFYDPTVAQFQDFTSFWEFVSGPLHAGTFGPNALDNTFGPAVIFQKAPPAGQSNLPPSAGLQFFGQIDLDPRDKSLSVALKDNSGATVFSQELTPGACW